MGRLTTDDLSFISNKAARTYVEEQVDSGNLKVDFSKEFDVTSNELTEVLQKMIEFNPYNRSFASELLKSPVFDSIRQPELEKPCPVRFELDLDDDFDYESFKSSISTDDILTRLYNMDI